MSEPKDIFRTLYLGRPVAANGEPVTCKLCGGAPRQGLIEFVDGCECEETLTPSGEGLTVIK